MKDVMLPVVLLTVRVPFDTVATTPIYKNASRSHSQSNADRCTIHMMCVDHSENYIGCYCTVYWNY
jgi:hypothetical protein